MAQEKIRNFCIIAHIDHGKSTLADRFLEITKTLTKREMAHGQMLDTMDIEQERGITIKLQPVRMDYKGYTLNLIDTPGHVDFSYEVSRSIVACEGAILVVDATQGIEAQTLANTYLALEHNLEIIPVLNKIDLPSADVEKHSQELENMLGIPKEEIIAVSAKEGTNVEKVLDQIIKQIPNPTKQGLRKILEEQNQLNEDESKMLIFDSVYDLYKGVLAFVRIVSGQVKKGDILFSMNTKEKFEVLEVGYFKPKYHPCDNLKAGEVGYIVTGLKSVRDAKVGDTLYAGKNLETVTPLPGYKKVMPMVFAGVFSVNTDEYPLLRDALEKLQLNDASLSYEPEQSSALGFGFRCGFLGLLHMEIIQERLEREYNLDLIITAPSVSYQVLQKNKTAEVLKISNPSELPARELIEEIKEPFVDTEIITPKEFVGGIMDLVQKKRGVYKSMEYLDETRVLLKYDIPLASIVLDFYDKLKSISSGYASMNYEFKEFRTEDLVKLDFLIAGDPVEALSLIVHRSEAHSNGNAITKKLKEVIPRANFPIALQAAIGGKVVARQTISAFRKDVTAGLYGGDVSRKNKLLKKQKAGKKRMKQFGKVNLPQEAFLAVLKKD